MTESAYNPLGKPSASLDNNHSKSQGDPKETPIIPVVPGGSQYLTNLISRLGLTAEQLKEGRDLLSRNNNEDAPEYDEEETLVRVSTQPLSALWTILGLSDPKRLQYEGGGDDKISLFEASINSVIDELEKDHEGSELKGSSLSETGATKESTIGGTTVHIPGE